MTTHYGLADKGSNQNGKVEQFKGEGPEEHIGFGADDSRSNSHGAKRIRKPAGGNGFATYKRGGKVKAKRRDDGGSVDTSASDAASAEKAYGDEGVKLYSGGAKAKMAPAEDPMKMINNKRGGRVKYKDGGGGVVDVNDIPMADAALAQEKLADRKRGGAVGGFSIGPSGGKPSKHGNGTTDYPKAVSMGEDDPTESTEPSPTKVDNRAFGGPVGGGKGKAKGGGKHKGGTHVQYYGRRPRCSPGHAPDDAPGLGNAYAPADAESTSWNAPWWAPGDGRSTSRRARNASWWASSGACWASRWYASRSYATRLNATT